MLSSQVLREAKMDRGNGNKRATEAKAGGGSVAMDTSAADRGGTVDAGDTSAQPPPQKKAKKVKAAAKQREDEDMKRQVKVYALWRLDWLEERFDAVEEKRLVSMHTTQADADATTALLKKECLAEGGSWGEGTGEPGSRYTQGTEIVETVVEAPAGTCLKYVWAAMKAIEHPDGGYIGAHQYDYAETRHEVVGLFASEQAARACASSAEAGEADEANGEDDAESCTYFVEKYSL